MEGRGDGARREGRGGGGGRGRGGEKDEEDEDGGVKKKKGEEEGGKHGRDRRTKTIKMDPRNTTRHYLSLEDENGGGKDNII